MTNTEPKLSPSGRAKRADTSVPRPGRWQPLMPRVMERIELDDHGCWVWQAGKQSDGYGTVSWQGRGWLAHRAVYTHEVGPVPEGMELDHLCRNRLCVNPAHLDPVTTLENNLRSTVATGAKHRAKTHCPQGHEYSPENTWMQPRNRQPGKFDRVCRTCYPTRTKLRTMAQMMEDAA